MGTFHQNIKMEEYTREPCPWRIIDDAGGAFTMGVVGGSIFHSISGARNAPKGFAHRFWGGITSVKTRSPKTGGGFLLAMIEGMGIMMNKWAAHQAHEANLVNGTPPSEDGSQMPKPPDFGGVQSQYTPQQSGYY